AGNGGTGILGPLYDGGNSWRIWQQDSKTNTLKAKLTPIKQLEINFDYSYQIKQYDRKYRLAEFDYLKGDEMELTTAGQNRINRSEEHTSELQSRFDIVCRLLLEKKK